MKKKCDICGRRTNRTHRLGGYTLCSKHMHQLHKYGKFLDNIPRTNNDLNDYIIDGDIAIFNLYNQKNVKIGEFIIDKDDLHIVKYKKWRISHNHVVTGLPAKGTQRGLSHVILGVKPNGLNDFVVDHINGNPMDNRKCNLRVTTQDNNVLNKSFMSNNTSGFIGVSYVSDKNRYDPEIRIHKKRCHLGYCKTKEEAVYARYVAEQLLFGEFANEQEQNRKLEFTKNLSQTEKDTIYTRVVSKLRNKGLWQ